MVWKSGVSVVELCKIQAISNNRNDWEQAEISPLTCISKIFYSTFLQGAIFVSSTTIKFILLRNIIGQLSSASIAA